MGPNRGGESLTNFERPPTGGVEEYSQNTEQIAEAPATPESSPSRQAAPPVIPTVQSVVLPSDDAATVSRDDSSSATLTASPASDKDKIEKQWVDRAKIIVRQTKDDPFTQKNEMDKVKAEYIEKRFNKKLKIDDAVA